MLKALLEQFVPVVLLLCKIKSPGTNFLANLCPFISRCFGDFLMANKIFLPVVLPIILCPYAHVITPVLVLSTRLILMEVV